MFPNTSTGSSAAGTTGYDLNSILSALGFGSNASGGATQTQPNTSQQGSDMNQWLQYSQLMSNPAYGFTQQGQGSPFNTAPQNMPKPPMGQSILGFTGQANPQQAAKPAVPDMQHSMGWFS